MKKTLGALGLALSLTAGQQAFANDQYFSVGYEAQRWGKELLGDDFDVGLLTGKAGYKVAEGIYLEGKIGVGITDDTYSESGFYGSSPATYTFTIDPKLMAGVFAVFSKDINESFDLYAKAGINYMSFDLKHSLSVSGLGSDSETFSESETKFAIGAGMNYFFNKQHGVNLELSIPSIGDIGDLGAFTVGYIFRM